MLWELSCCDMTKILPRSYDHFSRKSSIFFLKILIMSLQPLCEMRSPWLGVSLVNTTSIKFLLLHYATNLLRQISLIHWGQVMHICVSRLIITGSDNGLSPYRRQAIIGTNAGILLIGTLGTNFSEILIAIHLLSFKKMGLNVPSAKWRPLCLGLNVLNMIFNGRDIWICPHALATGQIPFVSILLYELEHGFKSVAPESLETPFTTRNIVQDAYYSAMTCQEMDWQQLNSTSTIIDARHQSW